MAALPQKQHTTVNAIYETYERRQKESKPRPHLGASIIGKGCTRAIWYDFRWATRNQFSGRLLRLFDTGNNQENRVIVDLRNAGITAMDRNPATGKQFDFRDHGGHMSGSMDAAVHNLVEAPKTWHVGEIKTHNAKSFKALTEKGVAEAKPQHLHQMNTYDGWSGMERWVYIAVNKDTDEIYVERGAFDKEMFEADRSKGLMVIKSPRPLAKISGDPEHFECKFCDHHPVCHVGIVPAVSCRTCVHATPIVDDGIAGRWTCARYACDLTVDQQIASCESHLTLPDLLPYAETLDSSDEYVVYRNKVNGTYFANCTNEGMPAINATPNGEPLAIYTSNELAALHPNLVGDEKVSEFKEVFGGRVVPMEQPKVESEK